MYMYMYLLVGKRANNLVIVGLDKKEGNEDIDLNK
jgi:hypothetical protein